MAWSVGILMEFVMVRMTKQGRPVMPLSVVARSDSRRFLLLGVGGYVREPCGVCYYREDLGMVKV